MGRYNVCYAINDNSSKNVSDSSYDEGNKEQYIEEQNDEEQSEVWEKVFEDSPFNEGILFFEN